jgi:class 3 adenylate cyclase
VIFEGTAKGLARLSGLGARVAALAGDGEVWSSSTVRDLVPGSGLVFEDRGIHSLKGVPEPWRLFVVTAG